MSAVASTASGPNYTDSDRRYVPAKLPLKLQRKTRFDLWAEKYRPISKFDGVNGSEDRFERFGSELEFVNAIDSRYVWSMVEGKTPDVWYICNGKSEENVVFYMITELPWPRDENGQMINIEVLYE